MSTSERGPFDGIRILEFGLAVAGPYAAELFAHGGADVVKIEPIEGDNTRFNSAIVPGEGRHYIIKARGKRGVPLNLRHPEARVIARQLALRSDIVISNMRPGVLARHGLDYESLSAENPRIIVAEISAFGHLGPYGDKPAGDFQAGAAAGLMMSTGRFDQDPPQFTDGHLSDFMAGTQLAFAVSTALYSRERSGHGQHVTTTLYQAALALQHATANVFDAVDGWKREFVDWVREERPHPQAAADHRRARSAVILGSLYQTADGRWITLGSNPATLARLHDALDIDVPDEEAPPAAAALTPAEQTAAVRRQIEGVTRSRDSEELLAALHAKGLPCTILESLEEAILGEHARANGFMYEADHPVVGPMMMPGAPVRFSHDRYEPGDRTPAYGEHLREVLGELDYTDAEIDQLVADQAVGEHLL
jgi:crotonobetainyl-CoA:carnitine CoA-transferase CaiB-like acyl-CoA transferase